MPISFVNEGLFGIALFKPYQLFGLTGLEPITHAVFWSIPANFGLLVLVSLFSHQSAIEQIQASAFVDALKQDQAGAHTHLWRGAVTVTDLQALVARFVGVQQANMAFENYAQSRGLRVVPETVADSAMVSFAEQRLAGTIGAASARVMIASVVQGEELSIEDVMEILDETSEVMEYSRRLEEKSHELEAASAELRAANERLQELDRLKDEFVSTVSHELRTPLTSIRAFSEILFSDPDLPVEERQRFLQIVVKETERLTRLINEVLDLAKIESGRMDWHIKPIDLRSSVEDAMNAVSQIFKEKKVELVSEFPTRSAIVNADRDRLIQVIINLLSNAAKFCEPETGRVAVKLSLAGAQIRLDVKDNGVGIEEEQIERLFDKFHQVVDQRMGKPQGTGLGLAISRLIIEHHGGRIWVESTIGKGSQFCIVLPRLSEFTEETAVLSTS